MMKCFKSEKGAITLYVSIACLFIVVIGVSAYVLSSNKQQAQLAQLKQIEEAYQTTITQDELYKEYNGGEIVTIYTLEQFLKIGTGEDLYINGKIYTMTANKTYILQKNWESDSNYATIISKVENANGVIIKDYE